MPKILIDWWIWIQFWFLRGCFHQVECWHLTVEISRLESRIDMIAAIAQFLSDSDHSVVTTGISQCDQTGLFLAHVAIFDLSVARKFWRAENSPITKLWLFLTFQNFISKITEYLDFWKKNCASRKKFQFFSSNFLQVCFKCSNNTKIFFCD